MPMLFEINSWCAQLAHNENGSGNEIDVDPRKFDNTLKFRKGLDMATTYCLVSQITTICFTAGLNENLLRVIDI